MKGLKLQVRSGLVDEEGILLLRLCTVQPVLRVLIPYHTYQKFTLMIR